MIATGTDIKPLECLLFLRDVRSRVYFEQMKGRGTRVLTPTDLQAVTGADARAKTHFVIVDAVGVCESDKTDSRPLERQPTVAFDKLLLGVALGKRDEDTLTTLAGRLARLDREIDPRRQRSSSPALAGGKTLADTRPARCSAPSTPTPSPNAPPASPAHRPQEVAPETFEAARKELIDEACAPFDMPALRDALAKAKQEAEQTIDTVTVDRCSSRASTPPPRRRPPALVKSFRDYIEQHQAEITPCKSSTAARTSSASPSRCSRNWRRSSATTMPPGPRTASGTPSPPPRPARSKGRSQAGRFADLVALVRFALEQQPVLAPFADSVTERFNEWLMDKAKAGAAFTPEQLAWLDLIRDHIATSLSIEPEDFELRAVQPARRPGQSASTLRRATAQAAR